MHPGLPAGFTSSKNQNMRPQYSVAISPPDSVIEQVRQLKQKLYTVIGPYGSAHSLAHISFDAFHINEDEVLSGLERRIAGFAATQTGVPLIFDQVGTFPGNGTFFLAPDRVSASLLVRMRKIFRRKDDNSFRPHISIGRRLTAEQLSKAKLLIWEADILFSCRDIVLRRFNEERKQYDIYKRFSFGA